jgi:hypothetical protein
VLADFNTQVSSDDSILSCQFVCLAAQYSGVVQLCRAADLRQFVELLESSSISRLGCVRSLLGSVCRFVGCFDSLCSCLEVRRAALVSTAVSNISSPLRCGGSWSCVVGGFLMHVVLISDLLVYSAHSCPYSYSCGAGPMLFAGLILPPHLWSVCQDV